MRAPLAISHYWHYLLAPVAFPPIALAATRFSDLPFDVLALALCAAFFASFAPPLWLLVTKKVGYSFWLFTGLAYVAAGVVTSMFVFLAERAAP